MIRLFVALIIPEEIRNQIVHTSKSIFPDGENLRWEDESKIHITLKFIGEVKDDLLQPIADELSFLESYRKINCTIEKFGFFFKEKNEPRILWLGLKTDDSLKLIVNELNNRLSKYSVPIEKRKFKAHITLLRINNKLPLNFKSKFTDAKIDQVNFTSTEIALMQSKLSPQGSKYIEIKKYILN